MNLIDYLPLYVQEYREISQIMAAEQPEIDILWEKLNKLYNDQFIMLSTEDGVKRWEKILSITPKPTDTMDERKFRIIVRLNRELPYTLVKLVEVLTQLCGEDGYTLDMQANEYNIVITLALGNKLKVDEVSNLLYEMLPANLTNIIKIMYNTHDVLHQLTHGGMHSYTHEELRNEVVTSA